LQFHFNFFQEIVIFVSIVYKEFLCELIDPYCKLKPTKRRPL